MVPDSIHLMLGYETPNDDVAVLGKGTQPCIREMPAVDGSHAPVGQTTRTVSYADRTRAGRAVSSRATQQTKPLAGRGGCDGPHDI